MKKTAWIAAFVGPILSLVAFLASYYLDPLNFGNQNALAAIPAFLLSVVILLISQHITTYREVERTSASSDRIYEAVKDYLHVTRMGTPSAAWKYIMHKLPELGYVQNTSFNLDSELERSNERLYSQATYQQGPKVIAQHIKKGLNWKDIGDKSALERFRLIQDQVKEGDKERYQFRFTDGDIPQIGFIILTDKKGNNEVLFNWDFHFQNVAQDPEVLLSRDRNIVRMFAAHYENLWAVAVQDYDSIATKSTS